MAHTCTSTYAY